ncbi:natural product biosynthesis luciferase-like monooxygenase protein [Actinokineospora baliensis]|uniref:MupA/Atu3671 family FMN-dependent luciferase-like monooxygenase n=1 Tax=Actinokineospora baliensis TaxID=547056 RepID=UPI0019578EB7|nr:MupA/Atu3671 family FMN-dependent luciferase-like monooxygenase [Actinokineospora baliensis]MBM7774659.1 natural product biosynthesis luciferase-like monooxygenase protein [Actinokineospora baliensis]
MDFSLFYFADDSRATGGDRYRLLLSGARFADEHGFSAVWTPERHFHPFGGLYPNAAVTSAAVAAITNRVAVRAGSVVAPLHDPVRLAEDFSVVDNLSNGRVGVSFASGWHASDFALRPDTYANRREVTLARLAEVRSLWRGEPRHAVDGAGHACELRVYPPPVQCELPVWLTSAGSVESFENAGRAGAGLLTHLLGQEPDELAAKVARYRKTAAEHGDGWPGHVVLMLHAFVDPDEVAARAAVRPSMLTYLRSSLDLFLGARIAGRPRIDATTLHPDDIDFIVNNAFDRYYDHGALLGSPAKLLPAIATYAAMGVDELACLIDFGLPADTVLAALPHLATLRELAAVRRS